MEPEIASAVEQAVAAYDARSAWYEEVGNKIETIAVIGLAVASASTFSLPPSRRPCAASFSRDSVSRSVSSFTMRTLS